MLSVPQSKRGMPAGRAETRFAAPPGTTLDLTADSLAPFLGVDYWQTYWQLYW
jgi:hypothetical protein